MRLLALLNPLTGHGHAAVVGGVMRALKTLKPRAAMLVASGGVGIPADLLPPGVDVVGLPALVPERGLFSELVPRADNVSRADLRKIRGAILGALVKSFRPQVVLVEHYPFGRHALRKELDPFLAETRARLPNVRIVSSLSVLGGRSPEHLREAAVIASARQYFDRVLVHTDPAYESLSDDYPEAARALATLVRHTGYVLHRPRTEWASAAKVRAELGIGARDQLVVAHAGGGRDGASLLRLTLHAHAELSRTWRGRRVHLYAALGSEMPDGDVQELLALAKTMPRARLVRHHKNLCEVVGAAQATIAMCGYATATEVAAANAPVLWWPRRSDDEQQRRAKRLEALGLGRVLPRETAPSTLASALKDLIRQPRETSKGEWLRFDLDGAMQAARELAKLADAASKDKVADRDLPAVVLAERAP